MQRMGRDRERAGLGLGTRIFHRFTRVASGGFGGSFGQRPAPRPPRDQGTVVVGEVELAYLRWPGPGPTLVLVHGVNSGPWLWAPLASLLDGTRDVIAIAQRGHGDSSAPDRGYSLEHTTADLLGFIDQLDLGPVDLVGHSWGGQVATHATATSGGRVRRLVLADPVPPRGINRLVRRAPLVVDLAFEPERRAYPNRAAMEAAARRLVYLQAWDDHDRQLWSTYYREDDDGWWRHRTPESAFRQIVGDVVFTDVSEVLEDIDCPVLLLLPTLSLSMLPGELAPLHHHLADLQVERVRGDHTFPYSNPFDTASHLCAFLEGRAGGTPCTRPISTTTPPPPTAT